MQWYNPTDLKPCNLFPKMFISSLDDRLSFEKYRVIIVSWWLVGEHADIISYTNNLCCVYHSLRPQTMPSLLAVAWPGTSLGTRLAVETLHAHNSRTRHGSKARMNASTARVNAPEKAPTLLSITAHFKLIPDLSNQGRHRRWGWWSYSPTTF